MPDGTWAVTDGSQFWLHRPTPLQAPVFSPSRHHPGVVVLRRCQGLDELRACVALQKEVWNFTDAELVPLRMFVVADKVGGQVMGAFDGDTMVGFALSVPGDAVRTYLSCIRICWRCARIIATVAWAAG